MKWHEFVCADCEADVHSFNGDSDETLCMSCQTIADLKAGGPMTPEAEATLREILGCLKPVQPPAQP